MCDILMHIIKNFTNLFTRTYFQNLSNMSWFTLKNISSSSFKVAIGLYVASHYYAMNMRVVNYFNEYKC